MRPLGKEGTHMNGISRIHSRLGHSRSIMLNPQNRTHALAPGFGGRERTGITDSRMNNASLNSTGLISWDDCVMQVVQN